MVFEKDLVVLVPDGAIQSVVTTLREERRPSLDLRRTTFDVIKDVLHDSSPESKAVELLRGFIRTHERALIVRDLAGSGWEKRGARALEEESVRAVSANGWSPDRVAAIIIEPELEIWLRLGSSHVQTLVQERARFHTPFTGPFYAQVVREAIAAAGGEWHGKPRGPKESFEKVLERFGIPRSNALYRELALTESLQGCVVPSFSRFVGILQKWFCP